VTDEQALDQPLDAAAADERRGVVVGLLLAVLIGLLVYFYWHFAGRGAH